MDNNGAKKKFIDKLKFMKNPFVANKIMVNIVLILFGAALISTFLDSVQTNVSIYKQERNNELALSEVVSLLNKNSESSDKLTEVYHEGNWRILDDIELLFSNGMFDEIIKDDNVVRSRIFTELSSPSGINYLYLLDMNGRIVMSPDESLYGLNPAATTHMTQENLNRIMAWCKNDDGTVTPALVKNQYGTFYFYSKPYVHGNEQYALVLGVSSWALDERIGSLKNKSSVLERIGVINDGFLFAVDREDGLFLYYKNDKDFLTGQDIHETGLQERVLTDGYHGTQTILGEKYYCTSKALDEKTVIVAAARSKNVIGRDKYVIIWSAMGFLLVMSLCLFYAVVVRNDYIRQGIQTERIQISKDPNKPVYFNKSVYAKVFPLMVIGLLAVFGISFYTQTLLEIEEGVDKSKVIMQEVIGRYEESQDSREIIEDYYNARFMSTAKLISFLVEESPDVLNMESDYYHSLYDEDGNRQYVLDDEGNRLKSVANSASLQKLCDENSIDAIYIFDENGHTIATNTSNWFFDLSLNEQDQSYPFRRILEGRADSYLQTAMTNDLGEEAQFFGIVLHYYTTTDSSGNTKYVSRYDFEQACSAEGVSGVVSAGGITKHRSLLQIELDEQLVESLTGITNAEYVLSSRMLEGGAIVMFDESPEHICLYSPLKTSIGRPAAELGMSPNAFNGLAYYGFNRINGTNYFRYFSYIDQYFAATFIPASTMFTSRAVISAITAGVCLIMITVLLLIITMSNEKEEEVYELLSREASNEDLNSTIFNIVLPSGRSASTTKASNRWNNRHIPWNERSPEMKLGAVLGWVVAIPLVYFVLSAVGITYISEEDSVIRYIMGQNWDRGPNVFALSSCIMVITTAVIGIELFRIPVRQCTALLGTQGETIGHLLLSIVRYGSVITAIFYCLYLLGIDSPNLLASAGLISLVIGLGAQSLIKDILAGIFIIFESEFRVGDIVTINGFRGTVTDIGLRTTKISGGGNVKIFNNSEISGVLNMTKETSVAAATIGLEYGQDINYVEEVLARELPILKEQNKTILDGPTDLGVSELAERRYTITVIARCSEQNVRDLNRFLNKSLLQIFARNGIRIANQMKETVKKDVPSETIK